MLSINPKAGPRSNLREANTKIVYLFLVLTLILFVAFKLSNYFLQKAIASASADADEKFNPLHYSLFLNYSFFWENESLHMVPNGAPAANRSKRSAIYYDNKSQTYKWVPVNKTNLLGQTLFVYKAIKVPDAAPSTPKSALSPTWFPSSTTRQVWTSTTANSVPKSSTSTNNPAFFISSFPTAPRAPFFLNSTPTKPTTRPTTTTTNRASSSSSVKTTTAFATFRILGRKSITDLNTFTSTTSTAFQTRDPSLIIPNKNAVPRKYALPVQTDCGNTGYRVRRIVNGREANPHSYSFLVSLKKYNKNKNIIYEHFCGGSLIYENYVLTAAHCLHEINEDELIVVLGAHDSKDSTKHSPTFTFNVSKIMRHDRFNHKNLENDIALIKLDRNVTLSRYVSLICLPSDSLSRTSIINGANGNDTDLMLNRTAMVAGWGKNTVNGRASSYLQQTELKIINGDPLCVKYSKKFSLVSYYCAYDVDNSGSSNVCFGDSGSPLFIKQNGRFYNYGVLSFVFSFYDYSSGKSNCLVNAPSYFTKTPLYLDWIAKKLYRSRND